MGPITGRVFAAGSRSPFRAEGRGPGSSYDGHLPDSRSPVIPVGSSPSSTRSPTRTYISLDVRHLPTRSSSPGRATSSASDTMTRVCRRTSPRGAAIRLAVELASDEIGRALAMAGDDADSEAVLEA